MKGVKSGLGARTSLVAKEKLRDSLIKSFALGKELVCTGFFTNFVQDRLKLELNLRKENLNKNNVVKKTEHTHSDESWSD